MSVSIEPHRKVTSLIIIDGKRGEVGSGRTLGDRGTLIGPCNKIRRSINVNLRPKRFVISSGVAIVFAIHDVLISDLTKKKD